MIYIHCFDDNASFEEQYNGEGYKEPWASYTKENRKVNYNKLEKEKPLTFNILSDGNIGWKIGDGNTERTIQYSKNGGEWTDITSTTGGTTISVVTGDVLRFKGDTWPGIADNDYSQFTSTCTFAASGNPASLKYGLELTGDEALAQYCYAYLFQNCTGMISAPALPATTLVKFCYQFMFSDCTSLTTAPELPATTLASNCYAAMFYGCTSLATAPELPATTLASHCYTSMFNGCTSLATAPELPATTLSLGCYYQIFSDCTSLATAPELPATTLADSCYFKMFNGCTGLTSAPELPATTLVSQCYSWMFRGCTSLTQAPELPATTLVRNCYSSMFYDCSKLNYVRCLATDISASNVLTNWLTNVPSTGTFYKAAGVTYPSGDSGIPAGWTVVEV